MYLRTFPRRGNAGFVSRSDRGGSRALARKVTTEERGVEKGKGGVFKPPGYIFPRRSASTSLSSSLSLLSRSRTFRDARPSRGLSTFCLAAQKRSLLRPLAAAEFAGAITRSFPLPLSSTALLFHVSSCTIPLPAYSPPLLLVLLLLILLPAFLRLLLLLLLLRSCRSLLLISLVSTSQGPFSRRSLLLTERVLHSRPLSPRIVFT